MILKDPELSPTDTRICEACWVEPVEVARRAPEGRDLLCIDCAEAGYPTRVRLFPPLGIFRLTERMINMAKHAKPKPGLPKDPGPALPTGKPKPTGTPGKPPV